MNGYGFVTAIAASLLASSVAHAQPSEPPVAAEHSLEAPDKSNEPPSMRWYGWQPLLIDGAAIPLMLGGVFTQNGLVGYPGVALYCLGGPAVHAVHGHPSKAIVSLALRTGMPSLVAGATFLVVRENDHAAGVVLLAGFLGGLGAVAIDAAVIAREPSSPNPEVAPATREMRMVVVKPILEFTGERATLSLGGAF